MTPQLNILQFGTNDEGGGAAAVAAGLMRRYRARGCRTWLAVGRKRGADADVVELPDDDRLAYRLSGYTALQSLLKARAAANPNSGWGLASRSLRALTHPGVIARHVRGFEDFDFQGTRSLLALRDVQPDIVHGHNLHGDYFDLRALAWLSHRVPTVLTLHDIWLLTGHCAHSLACERWRTGCGRCPSLDLYPALRRDGTAENWRRKREIYAHSRLSVVTPSRWLLDQAKESMLAPAIRDAAVIPNGVDLATFTPGQQSIARAAVGIPANVRVVLLTVGGPGSMWKDDRTLKGAIGQITARLPDTAILFVAVGRESALPASGRVNARSVPHQSDPHTMANYYRAADVYVHAARADTFPVAVLEALACGTPVVATHVGGIPEQIRPAALEALREGNAEALGKATGALVPAADAQAMAEAVVLLLSNDAVRLRLGEHAACDARSRFSLDQQVDAYLAHYRLVIDQWKTGWA